MVKISQKSFTTINASSIDKELAGTLVTTDKNSDNFLKK